MLWLIWRLTLLIITEVTDVAMPWERERRRQFLPHHFRKPSISNQDKVLILVDYFCRLNGGPTYCVKSPVLVRLFQDFTVYTRGWRSDKGTSVRKLSVRSVPLKFDGFSLNFVPKHSKNIPFKHLKSCDKRWTFISA